MQPLKYLSPNSNQRLIDAIAELRRAEGADGDAAESLAPELLDDIELHDVIHVVFACPTNLRGEILAHIWSVFGTELKMDDMQRVNAHEDHRAVLQEIGHRKLIRTWMSCVPMFVRVMLRASRMTRKWPAYNFQPYLDKPLSEIRAEFGIQLVELEGATGQNAGAALRSIREKAISA